MQEQLQGVLSGAQELEQVSLSCLHYLLPDDNNDPNFNLNMLMNSGFMTTQSSQDNVVELFYNSNTNSNSNGSSNLSTDEAEAEAEGAAVMKERKQRRMISNRESARRSRMRKQRHLDELWSHVVWLRSENHRLVDRLARASDTHDQVLLENSRLRQEAAELRRRVSSANP